MSVKAFRITEKAGRFVAGHRNTGVGTILNLSPKAAAHEIRLGTLIDVEAKAKADAKAREKAKAEAEAKAKAEADAKAKAEAKAEADKKKAAAKG